MKLFCCQCASSVEARLTNGAEIYSNRKDLASLPFWRCDVCGNYVGCHHKTKDRTRPLGCIPNEALRNARRHIHALIDPAWQSGKVERSKLYQYLSDKLGKSYHTADIRTIEEARNVYRLAREFIRNTV